MALPKVTRRALWGLRLVVVGNVMFGVSAVVQIWIVDHAGGVWACLGYAGLLGACCGLRLLLAWPGPWLFKGGIHVAFVATYALLFVCVGSEMLALCEGVIVSNGSRLYAWLDWGLTCSTFLYVAGFPALGACLFWMCLKHHFRNAAVMWAITLAMPFIVLATAPIAAFHIIWGHSVGKDFSAVFGIVLVGGVVGTALCYIVAVLLTCQAMRRLALDDSNGDTADRGEREKL